MSFGLVLDVSIRKSTVYNGLKATYYSRIMHRSKYMSSQIMQVFYRTLSMLALTMFAKFQGIVKTRRTTLNLSRCTIAIDKKSLN